MGRFTKKIAIGITLASMFVTQPFVAWGQIVVPELPENTDQFSEDENLLAYGTMAHNIYSDPDLSHTSDKFDSFMIDFMSDNRPKGTYWALCNWEMDTTTWAQKNGYNVVSGSSGAYGGLQNRGTDNEADPVAIMSFWETNYYQNGSYKTINAKRRYPDGENAFGGEGEGTNCISGYNWEPNKWYRMLIHCWDDPETGHTFVGQWFKDIESGKWTLISYFDTNITDSYFTGAMSQFQENYDSSYYPALRSFNYKNIYAREYGIGTWNSLNTTTLSWDPDEWHFNTAGSHVIGSDGNVFYGSSGLSDMTESTVTNSQTFSINQPDTPTDSAVSINSLTFTNNAAGGKIVSWTTDETTLPVLSYDVKIKNAKTNEVISSFSGTSPEISSIEVCDFNSTVSEMLATVSLTDVDGNVDEEDIAYIRTVDVPDIEPVQLDYDGNIKGSSLYAASISLNGDIGLNYYMKLSDEILEKYIYYYMLFTVNGEELKVNLDPENYKEIQGEKYYCFSCPMASIMMTDKVNAAFTYEKDREKVTSCKDYSYSVKDYALDLLEKSNDSATQKLIREMLRFGGNAQRYFEYNAGKPADEGIEGFDSDISSVKLSNVDSYAIKTEGTIPSSIEYHGSSLIIDSTTSIRHYFRVGKYNSAPSVSCYSYAEDEGVYSKKEVNLNLIDSRTDDLYKYYYIDIPNISANDLDRTYVVAVGSSYKIKYSGLSYARAVLSKHNADEKIKNVVRSMYLYNRAANNYFEN